MVTMHTHNYSIIIYMIYYIINKFCACKIYPPIKHVLIHVTMMSLLNQLGLVVYVVTSMSPWPVIG